MSLKYKEADDVRISRAEGFRISTVNAALKRLVENDETFRQTGVSPGVWERRWLNDAGNRQLYYMKGDAVWVNTEQADEFVASHVADIDAYAQYDAEARYDLAALSAKGDSAGIYRLYKDMALGTGRYQGRGIYYLGNLLDPVQIRVSRVDYNDQPPNKAGEYWEDFFDRTRDDNFYRNQILSAADAQLSAEYAKHLSEYHLPGLVDPEGFYAGYLQADMSNAASLQKFLNHAWYQQSMSGLDYSRAFRVRRLQGDQFQWFRLWNSGLLEHGGVVDVARSDCGSNDRGACVYEVDLSWGGEAPAYDFPADALGGFYSADDYVGTGRGDVQYVPAADALGPDRRYVVEVQPVQSLYDWTAARPYPPLDDGRCLRYPVREATMLNNGSFSFPYEPSMRAYSYRVRGFTTVNSTRAYRK